MRFGVTAILAGAMALSGAQMLSAQAGGAVKAAIDVSNKKFGAAIAAGDAKALGTIYTDDATGCRPTASRSMGVRRSRAFSGCSSRPASRGRR